jgi:hypothetical protein
MIRILLRDLRWRLVLLIGVALVLYALEPGFHQHDGFSTDAVALGPLGVSATLSYFAAISMIVLLGGFLSGDRREGYTRLFFAHPTSPLGYYGLRWGTAYALALSGAVLFLVVGQLVAWGGIFGGWRGLLLPLISAAIYGGLMAFLSVVLPRGDAWVAFLLLLPTFIPQLLTGLVTPLPAFLRPVVYALLPPQGALTQIWEGILLGIPAWGAIVFACLYGATFLIAAVLILRVREWP